MATASALTFLNIDYQVSTRPVTVTVTPASSSPTTNSDGSISVSNALTGEEITSTSTQRTSTLTVALGGDIYAVMEFLTQAELNINDEFALNYDETPTIETCAELNADFLNKTTDMWQSLQVMDITMTSAEFDPLIYCLATSTQL